ncbi:MAG: iron ABC transporter permease [Synechococcaceae cyanobacterium RL_1_2]|nr:iron ABC transporter permease [Synechococcaceae cyanobacterium RL_1_2]
MGGMASKTLSLLNSWTITVMVIAGFIATPILFVVSSIFADGGEVWGQLVNSVLKDYIVNSFSLMIGVAIGVSVLGISTAWIVSNCDFWGRKFWQWALLMPLAIPAYILAYVYTDLLGYYGPFQALLRGLFNWTNANQYWFPNVRSMGGAIAMFTLVLYPYVYLLTRVAFLEQSRRTLEAARSLGSGPWRSFGRIALPLARPAIFSGVALVLMETLSDFGTVQYLGVSTFTTGIYRTWFGRDNRIAAAQLAAILMIFILILIVVERWSRRRSRYYETGGNHPSSLLYELTGFKGVLATIACAFPVAIGFVIPGVRLTYLTIAHWEETMDQSFWQLGNHSLLLALITAAITLIMAIIMGYGQRLMPTLPMKLAVRVAASGYAIPGSVIAVGIMIPIGQLDNAIDSFARSLFGLSTGLIFSGTIVALLFAYVVRFLAVGFSAVESSLGKVTPNLDEASRSLGYAPLHTLVKVHLPIIVPGLLTSAILVFVDVMKELPATLVIRPFNFDTLAVRVYQYASDERLIEASAPALAIVMVGIIPVILLSWQITKTSQS